MARSLPPKTVHCYHCNHPFEVGGRAQSTSCPKCYKNLMVADQEITGPKGPMRELKTCGQVIITRKGRLICQHIVAHGGLVCEGIIEANRVESGVLVTLGPRSTFKGDLTAPAVVVEEGSKIMSSYFRIGEPPEGYEPPPEPPSHRGPQGSNNPQGQPRRAAMPLRLPSQR